MAFCTNCGTAYTEGAVVCPNCGYPTGAQPQVQYVQYVKPKVPGRGFGITSMVLGIVGLFYGFFLMFGCIALSAAVSFGEVISGVLVAFMFEVLIFSSLSIMATAFSIASKNRGYINGISKSGTIMGVIGLAMYLLSTIVLIGGSM